ncbi:MAG: hypothetical protein AVDCRST_MAG88-3399, partial [uncultured Thermomicrobiales bacterium]
ARRVPVGDPRRRPDEGRVRRHLLDAGVGEGWRCVLPGVPHGEVV